MVGVVHLPTALRFASGAVFKVHASAKRQGTTYRGNSHAHTQLPAALATFQLFEASLFAVQVVLLAAYLDYPLARVRIALVAIGCVQAALLMFVLHHEVLRRNTATHDTGRWCSKAATMAWAVTALLLAQTALLAAKLALAPHLPWGIVFCPLCGLGAHQPQARAAVALLTLRVRAAAYGLVTCAVQLRNFLRLSTSTVDEDDYAIVFQAICDLCFIAFMLFFVADSTDTWQVDWLLGTIPLFLAGLAQLCVVVATRIVPLVAPEPEFQAL